ncbi:putative Vesicle-associated membrane protein 7B [Blattamonas nauphoetae]|uniref:Vesicle-associated membrane protein 7B n=1 Tax=Blattamonas nauphoetae TaxID=2049346 RepID=A0ABQ9Y0N1_9EUKA|nr:putative Vesicle-associated membrane protein 7B [Blattamonas nauphoetae]
MCPFRALFFDPLSNLTSSQSSTRPDNMDTLLNLAFSDSQLEYMLTRATLYVQQGDAWNDSGRGTVEVDHEQRILRFDPDSGDPDKGYMMLFTHADFQLEIENQNILIWTDPAKQQQISLSFSSEEGLTTIYQQILDVLETLPEFTLPDPTPGRLKVIYENIISCRYHIDNLNSLSYFLLTSSFLDQLTNLRKSLDDTDPKNIPTFHYIFRITVSFFTLTLDVLHMLLSDKYCLRVVHCLEFDPDFHRHMRHQEFLATQPHLHLPSSLTDPSIATLVIENYRACYIRDTILPLQLDEASCERINSVIEANVQSLLTHFVSHKEVLSGLMSTGCNPVKDEELVEWKEIHLLETAEQKQQQTKPKIQPKITKSATTSSFDTQTSSESPDMLFRLRTGDSFRALRQAEWLTTIEEREGSQYRPIFLESVEEAGDVSETVPVDDDIFLLSPTKDKVDKHTIKVVKPPQTDRLTAFTLPDTFPTSSERLGALLSLLEICRILRVAKSSEQFSVLSFLLAVPVAVSRTSFMPTFSLPDFLSLEERDEVIREYEQQMLNTIDIVRFPNNSQSPSSPSLLSVILVNLAHPVEQVRVIASDILHVAFDADPFLFRTTLLADEGATANIPARSHFFSNFVKLIEGEKSPSLRTHLLRQLSSFLLPSCSDAGKLAGLFFDRKPPTDQSLCSQMFRPLSAIPPITSLPSQPIHTSSPKDIPFKQLLKLSISPKSPPKAPEQTHHSALLASLCDFGGFLLRAHPTRAYPFFLQSSIPFAIHQLIHNQNKQLTISTCHFFHSFLLHSHAEEEADLVNSGLILHIFKALAEQKHTNLVSATLLDLLSFICSSQSKRGMIRVVEEFCTLNANHRNPQIRNAINELMQNSFGSPELAQTARIGTAQSPKLSQNEVRVIAPITQLPPSTHTPPLAQPGRLFGDDVAENLRRTTQQQRSIVYSLDDMNSMGGNNGLMDVYDTPHGHLMTQDSFMQMGRPPTDEVDDEDDWQGESGNEEREDELKKMAELILDRVSPLHTPPLEPEDVHTLTPFQPTRHITTLTSLNTPSPKLQAPTLTTLPPLAPRRNSNFPLFNEDGEDEEEQTFYRISRASEEILLASEMNNEVFERDEMESDLDDEVPSTKTRMSSHTPHSSYHHNTNDPSFNLGHQRSRYSLDNDDDRPDVVQILPSTILCQRIAEEEAWATIEKAERFGKQKRGDTIDLCSDSEDMSDKEKEFVTKIKSSSQPEKRRSIQRNNSLSPPTPRIALSSPESNNQLSELPLVSSPQSPTLHSFPVLLSHVDVEDIGPQAIHSKSSPHSYSPLLTHSLSRPSYVSASVSPLAQVLSPQNPIFPQQIRSSTSAGSIATGSVVLSEYSSSSGNFGQISRTILQKIPTSNSKMSYIYENYTFHYVIDNRVVYLCLTDKSFDARVAFMYLKEVEDRFIAQYGNSVFSASANTMRDFNSQLDQLMRTYTTKSVDRIARAKDDVDELRGVVEGNIDKLLARQDKLELLVDQTEELDNAAVRFNKGSKDLKKKMWWKNVWLWVVIVVVILLIIFFIILIACGGNNGEQVKMELLTERELLELKEAFSLFDSDGDGTISSDSMGLLLNDCLGMKTTKEELNNMIQSMNKTPLGRVAFDDFADMMGAFWGGSLDPKETIIESFRVFDTDNSGTLTVNEFRLFFSKLTWKLSNEDVDDILNDLGVVNDGVINYTDFVNAVFDMGYRSQYAIRHTDMTQQVAPPPKRPKTNASTRSRPRSQVSQPRPSQSSTPVADAPEEHKEEIVEEEVPEVQSDETEVRDEAETPKQEADDAEVPDEVSPAPSAPAE